MSVQPQLRALRSLMKQRGLTAYLVPSTDAHFSEYVPRCWQRRAFITGFTGSAGDAVITQRGGGVWTDGRYFLQAETELAGSGLRLFKMGQPGVPGIVEHLARTLREGDAVGVDSRLVTRQYSEDLKQALGERGIRVRLSAANLVDRVWKDQPPIPQDAVHALLRRFAGETVDSKLKRLREQLRHEGADALVVTTLDAMAWLANVRGRDVEYNPVVISYGLVTRRDARWYVDREKIPPAVRKSVKPIRIRPYEAFGDDLRELGRAGKTVWVDGDSVSRWVFDRLRGASLMVAASPVAMLKAKKNATEMCGMRDCHVRDGVAMVRFLRWLEEAVPRGGVTEISASDKLEQLRSEGEHYRGLSFGTISGYAEHGAIIHYGATAETDVPLRARGIYLVDSGAQYLDGTTDITRTVLLGAKATRKQKDRFTRVLRGHIALARVRFPEGVRGMRLDTLARLPLWEAGLDYNHGTGHGVGSYLNVHEGPQSISPGRCIGVPLEPGNVQSNEPGYYEEGEFGIRVESLVLTEVDDELSRNGQRFLKFETLTLCPVDTRLVDVSMLLPAERDWLNDYHRRVKRTLSPHLSAADRRWLTRACRAI